MKKTSKELLFSVTSKDLGITYFSGTGAGGQHRNRNQNCGLLRHSASGAIVTGLSHKERKSNIKEAFNNLVNNSKFKLWHTRRIFECQEGKTIEQIVDELLSPNNLKVETKENGKWTVHKEEQKHGI